VFASPALAVEGQASDVFAARVIAKSSGARVLVTGLLDEFSTTYVNPDGTLTTDSFGSAIRVRDDRTTSGWRDLDYDLAFKADDYIYSSGKETNYGVIYDIQGTIKSSSIAQANSIVDAYYAAKPASSSSLATIRDANLSKYNYLVTNIPYLLEYRESIVNATNLSSYSSTERTTLELRELAALAGIGITSLVEYDDSDVTTYGSSESPLTQVFTLRLLGPTTGDYSIGIQSDTTRQYQLLRAAIAQLSQGVRFDPESLSGSSTKSPYLNL
jgi:hypothetical protein